jgi:hypothetical protein
VAFSGGYYTENGLMARAAQQTDPAQRVDPDPDQRQQTCHLQCGRSRLERALLVDKQRQLHRGDR